MKLESLNAILAAVQGCECADEDKQAAAQALTADFANSEDVPDDDAVAAMPSTMRALYQATGEGAADAAQKALILEDGREIVRHRKAEGILRTMSAAPKKTASELDDKTPITAKTLASALGPILDRALTSSRVNRMGMPPNTQTTQTQNQQQQDGRHPDAKVAKFAARKAELETVGRHRPAMAIQIAASEDQPAYDAWYKAGQPAK